MRFTKWRQAISDIADNPVLGLGLGNSDEGRGRPLNIVLEATAELGIAGLFIFIFLCYATMRKAMKFLNNKDFSNSHILMKLILVLFIHSLTHAMFSGIITDQIRLYTTMALIVCLDNIRLDRTKKLSQPDFQNFSLDGIKNERKRTLRKTIRPKEVN